LPEKNSAITILGAGSWGTAIAILLSQNGKPTLLWGHNADHISTMTSSHCNARYLPGIQLPDTLTLTNNLDEAVSFASNIIVAVPSYAFRSTLEILVPRLDDNVRIAWASKGIETETNKLLHEVAEDVLGKKMPLAVISGPTFASEVAAGMPTALTIASRSSRFANDLATRLHDTYFRAYTCDDVIGVEVGGAIKNVLAIAAGIADGLGFGANTRAAVITRGLVEMTRLGIALGGEQTTFMGLAGLGDLVLTCTDDKSRNRRLGLGIAQGKTPEQARNDIGQVVEGIQTSRAVYELASKHRVEMPICEQVYHVLFEQREARVAVSELFNRELKSENL